MAPEHVGQRVKDFAEERGVAPEAMAQALDSSVSTVYRWYSRAKWPRGKLRDAARALGVSPDALSGDVPTLATPPDAKEPAAPLLADGLVDGGERELWERIGYYRGKQELALENSETSSRLAREASEMLDRAIRALREVHEHTVPVPRGVVRYITPAQEAALADAEMAIQLRDAVRAEEAQEQASGAKRRGGKAG